MQSIKIHNSLRVCLNTVEETKYKAILMFAARVTFWRRSCNIHRRVCQHESGTQSETWDDSVDTFGVGWNSEGR